MADPYRDAPPKPPKPRARKCPACGLVNPAAAVRCDCGRSFVDGTMGKPLSLPQKRGERLPSTAMRAGGVIGLIIGGLMILGGLFTQYEPTQLRFILAGVALMIAGTIRLAIAASRDHRAHNDDDG